MGWVLQDETTYNTTHGTIFHGSDLGLSGFPGRIDIVAYNTSPVTTVPPDLEWYICLGAICTEPYDDTVNQIWVIYEQEQDPPGTPVDDGQNYQWNGIGNTIPADSGGYNHIEDPWEDVEFAVYLNGTGFTPTGYGIEVVCSRYEWEESPFEDYDDLPTEDGDPEDPGYLYPPDLVTPIPGDLDPRLITLEWVYSHSEHTGFAILDVSDPTYPTPVALVPFPTIREYAFENQYPRSIPLQFGVTAYNEEKKSVGYFATLDPIELALFPAGGALPAGYVGSPYLVQFSGENGPEGDYTYHFNAGTLPTGVTLNSSTGLLSGTPAPGTEGEYWIYIYITEPDPLQPNPATMYYSQVQDYSIQISAVQNPWEMTPTGLAEAGQPIIITGPSTGVTRIINDDHVLPFHDEVPYPATDECLDCFGDCPECSACVDACVEDPAGAACEDCMQACLDCLTACLENLEEAEECQGSSTDPDIDVIRGGPPFSGSVPLGSIEILTSNGSGIYTFVLNKSNDTVYTSVRDGTTYDIKIPNPGAKTAFFRG